MKMQNWKQLKCQALGASQALGDIIATLGKLDLINGRHTHFQNSQKGSVIIKDHEYKLH